MTQLAQPLAVTWGLNLKDARIKAGLTQVELGNRAGVTQYTISRIERGNNRPSDEAKFGLAEALSTSVESLFSYDNALVPA